MKKIWILFIGFITFVVGLDNILALDVSQDSLQLEGKSSSVTILDAGIGELGIAPKVEFNVVGDYVTYKLVLKNADGKKFKVNSVTDDNHNDSIDVSYDYSDELSLEDKEIFVTVKYVELPSNPKEKLKDIKVFIELIDEDENIQEVDTGLDSNEIATPKTFDNAKTYILLVLVSGGILLIIILYLYKKNKINKTMLVVLMILVLVPTIVLASVSKELVFNISFENTKINVKYTVVYNSNGGSEVSSETVEFEDVFTKPSDPTREGYDFVKWVDENEEEYDFSTLVEEDIVLNAIWKKKVYTVTLQIRASRFETQEVEHGDTVTRPADPQAPKFYYFDKWVDENGEEYDFSTPVTSDITINAKYEIITFTVTFDTDGGTPVPPAQTVKIERAPIEPEDPTKEGYIFEYWMLEGSKVNFDTLQVISDLTLTAKWKVAKSTLKYDGATMVTKMKQMANPSVTISDGYNYNDDVVRSFMRASKDEYDSVKDSLTADNIVSTDTSLADTYMWFDNGRIYYYTEAEKVYVEGSMAKMFSKFTMLSYIEGLEDFDVSGVTDMNRLFQNSNLIDDEDIASLANWDTSNVENMAWIFGGSGDGNGLRITKLDSLSSWNTSNVRSFQQAFKYAKSLSDISGISGWDVSSVGYDTTFSNAENDNKGFEQMFNWCTSLTDATAIKDWNILNAITTATDNGKSIKWSFNKMLGNVPGVTTQPEFTVRGGSWDSTGTYTPN